MGSRIGSIAILLVIAAIVAAVVVIISRLDLLDTGEPDAPVIVVSLDDGELVLLNEPQNITVTITSGSPIATLELFVDDVKVADVIPPYSQDRGAWIGSFVWTPERLGFANVRIVTLDEQGVESVRPIQVEVTDDAARVAAALRVQVLGIAPLQQFPAGASIRLAISATGSQAIERFDMLVDDEHIVSVSPVLDESGQYIAAIEWTPLQTGEVQVTIAAIDVAGREESQTVPVIIIAQGGVVPASGDQDQARQDAETSPSQESDPIDDSGVGQARIESPEDGRQFTLADDFSFDVEIATRDIGPVASALLYITPVAPNNTLGNSVLIHSSEGSETGDYSERIEDVHRWITSSGTYELQLVVFTPENDRYDHRITIHVVASAAAGDSDRDAEEETATSDAIDLAIVTARQAADDPRRLNVSIANLSSIDIERIDVTLTIVNANDGSELAIADVTMGIESEDLRTIPLDLDIDSGVEVDALVLLEASADTNASNNILEVTLSAVPESTQSQQEPEQSAAVDDDAAQQDDQAVEEEEQPNQPSQIPDLSLLDIQATSDGYVLLTVVNQGEGAATTFTIVISDAAGANLETISRRDADSRPLSPESAEILTSLQPHSGTIVITVVADPSDGERNLGNNTRTFELP